MSWLDVSSNGTTQKWVRSRKRRSVFHWKNSILWCKRFLDNRSLSAPRRITPLPSLYTDSSLVIATNACRLCVRLLPDPFNAMDWIDIANCSIQRPGIVKVALLICGFRHSRAIQLLPLPVDEDWSVVVFVRNLSHSTCFSYQIVRRSCLKRSRLRSRWNCLNKRSSV